MNEMQYAQWGGFGDLVFKGRLTPASFQDTKQWRVTAMRVVDGYPRHQSQGEDEHTMSIEMKFSNKFCDITQSTKALDDMADNQIPRTLVIGPKVYGQFLIRRRVETGAKTTRNGVITSLTYQCELVEVRA
ncbi:phage tail protein [Vibrio sp. OPT18]|uniref:phage tail protein n=1 Tax=Vibrio sp. OPT18 TaxID=2778641 RepID=UPI00187E19B6|nr:phage tail protein [Vibrio sp. OPT18]MBE8578635.1 phage tail protein [Vibrio sp. OPT18]